MTGAEVAAKAGARQNQPPPHPVNDPVRGVLPQPHRHPLPLCPRPAHATPTQRRQPHPSESTKSPAVREWGPIFSHPPPSAPRFSLNEAAASSSGARPPAVGGRAEIDLAEHLPRRLNVLRRGEPLVLAGPLGAMIGLGLKLSFTAGSQDLQCAISNGIRQCYAPARDPLFANADLMLGFSRRQKGCPLSNVFMPPTSTVKFARSKNLPQLAREGAKFPTRARRPAVFPERGTLTLMP